MADPRERVYAVACAAMFVFGMILGLPGTVLGLPEVTSQFGMTLADRGTLISTLFIGLLAGSVLSGPVVDRVGQRAALTASAALVALCMPMFAAASTFALAAAASGALGMAAAGMNTASNALSSDLFPEERGRRMNGIALVVGIGGLMMPVATAVGARALSWRAPVIAAAVLAAGVAIVGTFVPVPRARAVPVPFGAGAFSHFMRQPRFVWFGALLMLGAATEASMAGWTSTMLTDSGFTPAAATWLLSSHWLGLIAARILFSHRVDRVKRTAIVRAALCGSLSILIFAAAPWDVTLIGGPFVIGFAIAVIVPTSLALAGDRLPGNAGTLFGMLLTLAQVGGIVMPVLIGLVADRAGVRVGLSLLVANGLVVALVAHRAGRPR
jgi:MFS family permease